MTTPTIPYSAVPDAWARNSRCGRPEATVHGLFSEVARRQPGMRALSWANGEMTYGDLDSRSTALAQRLAADGVCDEKAVALFLQRGPDAIVAMLAVLKAGGTYVPLDPSIHAPASNSCWVTPVCIMW